MRLILYITSPSQSIAFLSALVNSEKLNKCNYLEIYIFSRNITNKKELLDIFKHFLNKILNLKKLVYIFASTLYLFLLLFF